MENAGGSTSVPARARPVEEPTPRDGAVNSATGTSPGHSSIGGQVQGQDDALAAVERKLAAGPQTTTDEISLNFAAAALLDRAGRYEEAFAHARKANGLVGAKYDASSVEGWFDRTINYFTRRKAQSLPRALQADERPVFIVGMPRSGTSLVEHILASHPQVYGAGALEAVSQIARQVSGRLGGAGFPQVLDRISSSLADEMARAYLGPFANLAPGAQRVTDRFALNFLHLGLISILFPRGRVMHCRRDARDTCISCFMTQFSGGNEFSHDLQSCGHFYRQYERLITHWKDVLEIPILEVSYETVVENPEAQRHRIIEFLGLNWGTASDTPGPDGPAAGKTRVREPIFRSSVGRWRHYANHLIPLLAGLGWG